MIKDIRFIDSNVKITQKFFLVILIFVACFIFIASSVNAVFPYCLQKYSENGNGFWDGWLLRSNWATLPGNIGTQHHNSGGSSPLLTIPGEGKKISATYDIKFATEDDFAPGPSGYGKRVGGGGHFASVISRSHSWCPEGTSCNNGDLCYDKWLRVELTSPTEEGFGLSVRNHGATFDQFCQSNSFGHVPGMRLRHGQWIRIRHEGEITGANSARLTLQYISIDGTPLVGQQYTKVWNCNFVNPVPILHFYSFGNYDKGTQSGATYGDMQTRNLQFSVENSGEPPQSCSDGTSYNQCSTNKPLYCNNGNLENRCSQCGCPSQQTCQPNGICSGSPNRAPTATITQPTQTIFTVNTTINYAGIGTDPDGTIVSYSWTLDIIGDGQQPFNIGNQQSGTYTPILLVNNLSTTYRLTLTVTDNDGAPGTNFKELTIVPSQQNLEISNIVEQPLVVFDFNSIISYLGVVSDPNGPIPDSQMTWEYDITGDDHGPFSLGIGRSGSFIANRTIGPITLYKLRFTGNDGQYTDVAERSITILSEPVPTECQLTSAEWQETNVNESTLVNLIVNGNNCNGKLVNFVVWEEDILDGDDPVQQNPQSVTFNNNVATGSWIAEFQEDCGGACNPPEYIFIASLNENSNVNIHSSNQLIVNENVENLPPSVNIEAPRFGQQFNISSIIAYFGVALDPEDGDLQGNSLVWRYDIIGDNQGFIALGNGQSGTFTPTLLVNNSPTIYRFELTAFDSSNLSGSAFVDVRLMPIINPQQCLDGTLYNQCSINPPVYCNNNGQLINNCQQCGCPQQQICQANGACQGGPNQAPTATITQPTQTQFTVNTLVNYSGFAMDPEEGSLPGSRMRWILNISGVAEYINLGPGDSGSFFASVLRNNQPTLYTLKLVATDSHRLSGNSRKLFTVVPFNQTQQNLTESHWLETEYATIVLPMAVYNDSQASNGRYIGSYVSDGYGQLQFTLSNPGTYYLWMRTKWSGGSSNSLFVSIDNQPEIGFGNDYTFNEWHWINSFQSHEVPEIVTLQLGAGSHLIKIRGREAGGLFGVDKILLTGNPGYIPNGLGESGENKPLPPQQQTLFFDNFERYPIGPIPLAWVSNAGTWQVVADSTNTYEGYMSVGNAYSYPNNQSHLTFRNYKFEAKFKLLNSSTGMGFIGYHNSGRAYQIRYRSFPGQIFVEDITNFNGELGQDLYVINYSLEKDIWYKFKSEFETQTSKTIVRMKMWREIDSEPSLWLITYEDARPNRIQQGGIGLVSRHLANRFDDVRLSGLNQQSPRNAESIFARILNIFTLDRP